MNGGRKYIIDGMELNIPLYYDKQSGKYIENYEEWINNKIFTPLGHLILFAGEDACEYSLSIDNKDCLDCGSCKFYQRASEETWIGICTNKKERRDYFETF
ncbi:MAG: hypothetical protein LUG60_02080 [Erysipelotrichaceae bacterium]|nr:hypothetical protein [Erysipelotrichaceae bacterium]